MKEFGGVEQNGKIDFARQTKVSLVEN